jgi:hypothetical protein
MFLSPGGALVKNFSEPTFTGKEKHFGQWIVLKDLKHLQNTVVQ